MSFSKQNLERENGKEINVASSLCGPLILTAFENMVEIMFF